MHLECHKCGHKWNYEGNSYRAKCCKCTTWVRTGLKTPWEKSSVKSGESSVKSSVKSGEFSVQQNIVNGSILDAMDKANFDLLNNKKLSKEEKYYPNFFSFLFNVSVTTFRTKSVISLLDN